MSGEKIVRALDAIPDEQLESAMSVYERRKKLKYIWVRVAAALIVLAVLLLLLLGCASSEDKLRHAAVGEVRCPSHSVSVSNRACDAASLARPSIK